MHRSAAAAIRNSPHGEVSDTSSVSMIDQDQRPGTGIAAEAIRNLDKLNDVCAGWLIFSCFASRWSMIVQPIDLS